MTREIDAEKIRSEAKRAMENLGDLSGSTQAHTVELCLQHIWTAAGGETGMPGTDEYMAALYPDDEGDGEDASERTRAEPEDDDGEWEFESGDIIREERAISVDDIDIGKSEYKIERLLRTESAGDRFYHVEKEEGGNAPLLCGGGGERIRGDRPGGIARLDRTRERTGKEVNPSAAHRTARRRAAPLRATVRRASRDTSGTR